MLAKLFFVLFTTTYTLDHSLIDLSSPEKYILDIENSLNESRYEDATVHTLDFI
jgi:hypothetical protein